MKKFVIFGVSAFLSDIFDLIHACGGKVYKIYLNIPEVKKERQLGAKERVSLLGYHVDIYDSLTSFQPEDDSNYIVGTTTPQKYKLIEELKEKYRLLFSSLIHPTVYLGSNVHIGEGVLINVCSTIGPNVYLDDHSVINRCTNIGHDSRIGKYSSIGPSVSIAGSVRVGDKCTVGINATILERICIGDWTLVGAGSLVTKDMPKGVVVYGVPAKIIRENEKVNFEKYKANLADYQQKA